ncbi:accessory Sec system protein translocase subunit SecY2 [Streptococcus pluranimalium]|uniref:accessory Sec system protein translocase subunit SecY2 n=1 Tax=Streptococcus pluranimalium TaxID=82348 RepID=UPI003F68CDF7
MRTFLIKHFLFKKILVSLGIILLFLIGRSIPVPLLSIDVTIEDASGFLTQSAAISGASLSKIGLFSLGMSPWMSSMILMRLLSFGRFKKSSQVEKELQQNLLMLLIALIQGLSISLNLPYESGIATFYNISITSIIFVTGAFIISWLGKLNAAYGIGSTTLLIIVGMILGLLDIVPVILEIFKIPNYRLPLIGQLLWTVIGIYIMVLLNQSEYRILVKRVAIHSNFDHQNFVPLKLNAAGGMPMMYALSILMLPQYIILLLKEVFPETAQLEHFLEYLNLTNPVGLVLYIAIVIYLNISFALLNVDPTNISKNFRSAGDFIPGIRPGKETKDYITSKLLTIAGFSGVIMAFLLVIPVILSFFYQRMETLVSLTSMGLMVTGIMLSIIDEVKTSHLKRQYRSIFTEHKEVS